MQLLFRVFKSVQITATLNYLLTIPSILFQYEFFKTLEFNKDIVSGKVIASVVYPVGLTNNCK